MNKKETVINKNILSPKKLYGRKLELKKILNIFNRVRNGKKELFLVKGYSGIGKTALITEAQKEIIRNNGCFISGKFDQFERNIPYSAIIHAFQHLILHILSKNDIVIKKWKEKIVSALGPNGQVIINVIPELELLIGKQSSIPELGLIENQNRFKIYFQKFTSVFTTSTYPLVMFIDDLQWADLASLTLLKTLITNNDIKYFFLIGAFRNNEVTNIHPLRIVLDEIKRSKISYNEILLESLKKEKIDLLLMDSLNSSSNKISDLSNIIHKKTAGNPFFIYEFLNILYQEKVLIKKNNKSNINWKWENNDIIKRYVTDNVGDILTKKISKLSKKEQEIIALCACIGNRFNLKTFSLINNCNETDAIYLLSPLIREGFIFFADSFYYFVHDQVQQSAYSLLDNYEKKEFHYKIGKIILKKSKKEDFEKNMFFVIDQLNSGSDVIKSNTDLNELIELNLAAGRKAKKSTAYGAALKYFKKGIQLLGKISWKIKYDLTLTFHNETAETALLNTDYNFMDKIIDSILLNTKSLLDQLKSYEIKIHAFIAQYKHMDAVDLGCDILKKLGVYLNKKPSKLNAAIELMKTALALRGKSIDELREMQAMTNKNIISAINIMMTIGTAVYYSIPNLIPIIVLKIIRFELKYGRSPNSSYLYASYGIVLIGVLNNIDLGYKFGKFSLSLIEGEKTHKLHAKIHLIFNIFIRHWKCHLNTSLGPLLENYKKGLETGDPEYAALSVSVYCKHSFFCSKNLSFVDSELERYSAVCKKLAQEHIYNSNLMIHQFILNLIGKAEDLKVLTGTCINEHDMIEKLKKVNNKMESGYFYLFKSILNFLFYDYKEAFNNIIIVKKYSKAFFGLIYYPIYIFYYILCITAFYDFFSVINKIKYKRVIIKNMKKIKKWAKNSPDNFLHKYYIINGEFNRINGKYIAAIECYEKAALFANKNEYINEEAIANELAAKLCFKNDLGEMGRKFINNSYECYLKWGSYGKVKHLEELYSDYISINYKSLHTE